MSEPALTPVAELSYEDARDELVRLVSRIESGKVPLEEAMELWQRGEELAAHCQAKLDAAQEVLERGGGGGTAPDGGSGAAATADVDPAAVEQLDEDAEENDGADAEDDLDDDAEDPSVSG